MSRDKVKIKSFTDLNAWKMGHKLVLLVYKSTSLFPKSEMFGLTNQMRRCAVSITSNIAEGFSRSTYKDKSKFYFVSLGSITELQNQLIVARDVGYIAETQFDGLYGLSVMTHKIVNGLIKSSRSYFA